MTVDWLSDRSVTAHCVHTQCLGHPPHTAGDVQLPPAPHTAPLPHTAAEPPTPPQSVPADQSEPATTLVSQPEPASTLVSQPEQLQLW